MELEILYLLGLYLLLPMVSAIFDEILMKTYASFCQQSSARQSQQTLS